MSLGFIFTISILHGQPPGVIGVYSHIISCIALMTQGCKRSRDGQFFLSAEMVSRIWHSMCCFGLVLGRFSSNKVININITPCIIIYSMGGDVFYLGGVLNAQL